MTIEEVRKKLLSACNTLLGAEDQNPLKKFFRSGPGIKAVQKCLEGGGDPDLGPLALALYQGIRESEAERTQFNLLAPIFQLLRIWKSAFGLQAEQAFNSLKIEESRLKVIPGSLKIKRDCRVGGGLIVLGDLRVDGALRNYGEWWSSGTVVVLGSLTCSQLVAMGPSAVGSVLSAKEGVYGEYFHDAPSTFIAHEIRTPFIAEFGDRKGVYAEKFNEKPRRFALDKEEVPPELKRFFNGTSRAFDLDEAGKNLFSVLSRIAR